MPPLIVGSVGGFLASFIVGGGGLLRYAITGFLGLFLGTLVLRALGLSLAIRNPLVAKIVTAAIGAAAVVLLARMIA
ncbi:MAG: GlsB/YeaQ/YmgE family stress response membrane protein [Beijerinckiaceae bacterium]